MPDTPNAWTAVTTTSGPWEVEFADLAIPVDPRFFILPQPPESPMPIPETPAAPVDDEDDLYADDAWEGDEDDPDEDEESAPACDTCANTPEDCDCPRCPGCDEPLAGGACPACRPAPAHDPAAAINPPGSFDAARYRRRADGYLACRVCGHASRYPAACDCCPRCQRTTCRCCPECRLPACTCAPLDPAALPPPEANVFRPGQDHDTHAAEAHREDRRAYASTRPDWIRRPLTFYPPDPAAVEQRAEKFRREQRRADPVDRWAYAEALAREEAPLAALRAAHRRALAGGGPRRYLSVELEVGGLKDARRAHRVADACARWNASVVYDGSLPPSGFEINLSPARGKPFIDQVEDVCRSLRAAGAWVNARCGLHVHADSRDLSSAQILRLVEVYARVEDGLFLAVPDSRRRNSAYTRDGKNFCEKCGQKLLAAVRAYLVKPDKYVYWGCPEKAVRGRQKARTRHLARLAVYGGLGSTSLNRVIDRFDADGNLLATEPCPRRTGAAYLEQARDHYATARYYALNLHAHFYTPKDTLDRRGRDRTLVGKRRGTVECRLAAGTTDPQKIVPWALLWDNLLHVATAWPTDRINGLPRDPWQALLAVAPSDDVRAWLEERKAKFAGHEAPPYEEF